MAFLDTVLDEPVPEPCLLEGPRMERFAARLAREGYTLEGCAARVGCHPRLGVNFFEELRPKWVPSPDSPVDVLLSLFIAGHDVNLDRCSTLLSEPVLGDALEMKLLVREGDRVRSDLCLFPCYGRYVVTDRARKNKAINQVMWLWSESFILGGMVKRVPRARAIDLCTGSGIHAILASAHCEEVVGVDISPRAIAFSTFNQRLNGVANARFLQGDLWGPTEGTCDLLLANPPYSPDLGSGAGDNFWSGGPSGTELLARVVGGLPARLNDRGVCHIVALYPNPPGTTTAEHFNQWLGGQLHGYQVLDHSWPVPGWADPLSIKPFAGDKRAWRFGVVSLRKVTQTDRGYWRQVGVGKFFDARGECVVIADHDAVSA